MESCMSVFKCNLYQTAVDLLKQWVRSHTYACCWTEFSVCTMQVESVYIPVHVTCTVFIFM